MQVDKRECNNCVLHSRIPGITINDEGLCSVCVNYKKFERHEPQMRKYLLEEMENLFEAVKKKPRPYHAIVLFSGGKDSTMLLKIAKEKYGLRTLAFAVMHPLVNKTADRNMVDVANRLHIDLLKAYLDEDVYKKCIRQAILKGPEYGLGEFFGCNVCSFFHSWIPVRYALNMDIPVILEGSDLSQTGEITYHQPGRIIEEARKGNKPFGRVHDLVSDALGEEYKGSIYDYSEEEMMKGNYPTIISPFSFMDYDYRENFREIKQIGLQDKAFRTIYTNCSATPFFSYFSLKRFACVSYIKHYATEVRRGYPNLMQHSVRDEDTADVLNKATVEKMIKEYETVVLYVAENNLSEETITPAEEEKLKRMAPTYIETFGQDVCDVFMHDVLQIPYFMDYFGIDIDDLSW